MKAGHRLLRVGLCPTRCAAGATTSAALNLAIEKGTHTANRREKKRLSQRLLTEEDEEDNGAAVKESGEDEEDY